jgi:hypothetical protein
MSSKKRLAVAADHSFGCSRAHKNLGSYPWRCSFSVLSQRSLRAALLIDGSSWRIQLRV